VTAVCTISSLGATRAEANCVLRRTLPLVGCLVIGLIDAPAKQVGVAGSPDTGGERLLLQAAICYSQVIEGLECIEGLLK
jgi:hypothetical protein